MPADLDDVVRVHPGHRAAGEGEGRRSREPSVLGTAVFGGMLAATILAVFFVPVFHVFMQRISELRKKPVDVRAPPCPAARRAGTARDAAARGTGLGGPSIAESDACVATACPASSCHCSQPKPGELCRQRNLFGSHLRNSHGSSGCDDDVATVRCADARKSAAAAVLSWLLATSYPICLHSIAPTRCHARRASPPPSRCAAGSLRCWC